MRKTLSTLVAFLVLALPGAAYATYPVSPSTPSASTYGKGLDRYNQGLAIGNDVLRYRITHQGSYLLHAQEIATASEKAFSFSATRGGDQLHNAVYFRNLEALQAVSPSAQDAALIARYKASLSSEPAGYVTKRGLDVPYVGRASTQQFSYLWPFGQVVATELTATPQNAARIVAPLKYYYDVRSKTYSPSVGGKTDVYYDDNVWVGLDFAEAFALNPHRAFLLHAKRVFAILKQAWQPTFGGEIFHRAERTHSGGSHQLSTVTTLGAEQLALKLYLATGRHSYLAWANRAQVWLDEYMLAPSKRVVGYVIRHQVAVPKYETIHVLYYDHLLITPTGLSWGNPKVAQPPELNPAEKFVTSPTFRNELLYTPYRAHRHYRRHAR